MSLAAKLETKSVSGVILRDFSPEGSCAHRRSAGLLCIRYTPDASQAQHDAGADGQKSQLQMPPQMRFVGEQKIQCGASDGNATLHESQELAASRGK